MSFARLLQQFANMILASRGLLMRIPLWVTLLLIITVQPFHVTAANVLRDQDLQFLSPAQTRFDEISRSILLIMISRYRDAYKRECTEHLLREPLITGGELRPLLLILKLSSAMRHRDDEGVSLGVVRLEADSVKQTIEASSKNIRELMVLCSKYDDLRNTADRMLILYDDIENGLKRIRSKLPP